MATNRSGSSVAIKDERGMRTPTLNAASGTKKEPAGVSGRGLLVCRDVHGPLRCLANDIVSRLFLPSQGWLRGVGDGLARRCAGNPTKNAKSGRRDARTTMLSVGGALGVDDVAEARGLLVIFSLDRPLELVLEALHRVDRQFLADAAGEPLEDFDFARLVEDLFLAEADEELADLVQAFGDGVQGLVELLVLELH